MSNVIVIEPDQSTAGQIEATVKAIDGNLEVVWFRSLLELNAEIERLRVPQSDNPPTVQLKKIVLIIVDAESNRKVPLDLWGKLMGFIDSKDPAKLRTRLIFTGFETGAHKEMVERYIHNKVFNLVIKPFDALMLKQTLSLALAKDGPLRPAEVFSQQAESVVEIIKDIEIEVLTELGFRTRSSREIPTRKMARYYGEPFLGPNGNSVFAYAYHSRPSETEPGMYSVSFSYLGIPKEQLASIRRFINTQKDKEKLPFYETAPGQEKTTALIISRNPDIVQSVNNLLSDRFVGIETAVVGSMGQLMQRLAPEGKGESSGPRAFDTKGSVEFQITLDGKKILALNEVAKDQKKPLSTYFGQPIADHPFKPPLEDIFAPSDRAAAREMVKSRNARPSEILQLQGPGGDFSYLRIEQVQALKDSEEKEHLHIQMRELTPEEISHHLSAKDPWLKIRMVFIEGSLGGLERLGSLREVVRRLGGDGAKLFLLTKEAVTLHDHVQFAHNVDDILQLPIDFFYYTRKIKMHCLDLAVKNADDAYRYGIKMREGIRTAMPVKMTAVSEAHLSLDYHRPLKIGDVRMFMPYVPNLVNMPEVHGVCVHCEEGQDKVYKADFLFFGLHDHQLKYLRRWIKERYVQTKKA